MPLSRLQHFVQLNAIIIRYDPFKFLMTATREQKQLIMGIYINEAFRFLFFSSSLI